MSTIIITIVYYYLLLFIIITIVIVYYYYCLFVCSLLACLLYLFTLLAVAAGEVARAEACVEVLALEVVNKCSSNDEQDIFFIIFYSFKEHVFAF